MPDGDKVHEGLAWKYQKAYKQICDGQFGGRELASEVVAAVWKDVQKVGDKLIPLFQQVAEQCKHIQDRRLFEEIDWQKESGNIEELSQPIYASQRAKSLAVEACKEQVQELRYGATASNYLIEILTKYVWNVYKANFAERVPLAPSHHQGVNVEFIYERLEVMEPYVRERLRQFAEQIYRCDTFYLPRQPRQRSGAKPNYNIDTDVSTIGV